jgi:hypothetical protein
MKFRRAEKMNRDCVLADKDYNLYDITAVQMAMKRLKTLPRTTRLKAQHGYICEQLRTFIYDYCTPLNRFLFQPEGVTGFAEYAKAINWGLETKVELDNMLAYTLDALYKDLNELILTEYQTQDGTLIQDKNGNWKEQQENG